MQEYEQAIAFTSNEVGLLLATNMIGNDSFDKSLRFRINYEKVEGCSVPDDFFGKVDEEID